MAAEDMIDDDMSLDSLAWDATKSAFTIIIIAEIAVAIGISMLVQLGSIGLLLSVLLLVGMTLFVMKTVIKQSMKASLRAIGQQ